MYGAPPTPIHVVQSHEVRKTGVEPSRKTPCPTSGSENKFFYVSLAVSMHSATARCKQRCCYDNMTSVGVSAAEASVDQTVSKTMMYYYRRSVDNTHVRDGRGRADLRQTSHTMTFHILHTYTQRQRNEWERGRQTDWHFTADYGSVNITYAYASVFPAHRLTSWLRRW